MDFSCRARCSAPRRPAPWSSVTSGYSYIGSATIGNWPVLPIALFVAYFLAHVVLAYSAWSRSLHATGGNRRAANAAGINVKRARLGAFTAFGFLAGLAGSAASASPSAARRCSMRWQPLSSAVSRCSAVAAASSACR